MEATPEQLTPEQQAVETEALARLNGEQSDPLEGFNEDGTAKEELIAGKFKTQEDLLKAYKELETKLGQPKETVQEETKEVVPDVVEKGVLSPNDFDSFSKEYNEKGSLGEDTYKTLEKKGLSKEIVDAYIEGQKAIAQTKADKLLNYVGGKDTYNSMIEWAKTNYDAEQAKMFDEALFSGKEGLIKDQIDLLSFRMNSKGVKRLEGASTSGVAGLKPFSDKGEWQSMTRNKLYGTNEAYTNMVDGRYLASKRANTL